MNEFEQNVIQVFASRRWRMTAAVRNIVKLLGETKIPLSVHQIDQSLRGEHDVDASTVYRILERMEKSKLVHNLKGKFFRCSKPEETKRQHHFLLCKKCGGAEEIFLDYRESIARQLAQEKNFVLQEVEMYFWGVCKDCS